jgi:hypothetical protein
LVLVKPETVVAWHRRGFRWFWTWKVRQGRPGRPAVVREVRDLIRRMCRENPTWGAPRIHGELLKPGIDIGQTSVSKYMVPPAILSNLAHLLTEPRFTTRLHRFLYRPDHPFSGPLRVSCPGT